MGDRRVQGSGHIRTSRFLPGSSISSGYRHLMAVFVRGEEGRDVVRRPRTKRDCGGAAVGWTDQLTRSMMWAQHRDRGRGGYPGDGQRGA